MHGMRINAKHIFNKYNKMKTQYNVSITIAIVHFIIKYIETHVVKKEPEPLKKMFRESFFVFLSCIMGFFVMDQLSPMFNDMMPSAHKGGSIAFTDDPSF